MQRTGLRVARQSDLGSLTDCDALHQTYLFVLRRYTAIARHCQNVWRMKAFRLPVASEVVREVMRLMDGQDRLRGAKREQLHGAVRQGFETAAIISAASRSPGRTAAGIPPPQP